MRIIDLTHMINAGISIFPGTEKPVFIRVNTLEQDGFTETKFSMYSHTGTHIDAPSHMLAGANSLDQYGIEQFFGKAIIIDCINIENNEIELRDIIQYKEKLKGVDFVLLKTGWSQYWGNDRYFHPFPALTVEAAEWLIGFDLKGIGVDAISIDDIKTTGFPVHHILFKNNVIIIENLVNLDLVNEACFIFSCLPIKYENADGSPVRAIAIEEP